jgi:pimeloyl-ACP methyl ester carboxylesterase
MFAKNDSLSFFSEQNTIISHIVIPTSVEHSYENSRHGKAIRNALYIKKYESNKSNQNPIVFFHGGPEIVNEEQFSIMQNYFTQRGYTFYIPEIEGSTMYASSNKLPKEFELTMIPSGLKLLELNKFNATGLNEFSKNYADDVKDVLEEISKRHPGKKINIIAHSLGSHQVLRTLQHYPELSNKIEAVCSVAGTSDIGANRFINTLKDAPPPHCSRDMFESLIRIESSRFLKSSANENQAGPNIDKHNNPCMNQQMNQAISVLYGDVSRFPALLIVHAVDDKTVFFQSSILLQQKIQQSGSIAHGLYFSTGAHQFIKNEGKPEIRIQALEGMEGFFNQPTQKIERDFSQLQYEDVYSQHQLFLQDKESYLNNIYKPNEEAEMEENTITPV